MKDIFLSLQGVSRFFIYRIEEDCVEIPSRLKNLYGIVLTCNTEILKTVDSETIKRLLKVKSYKYDKFLFQVIQRYKEPNTGFFLTKVYFFSYNKELLKFLERNVWNSENVRWLSGLELANVLYELYRGEKNSFFDPKNYVFYSTNNFFDKNDIPFPKRGLWDEIDYDKYDVYVSSGISEKNGIERILASPWTGVFYFIFNLNDLTSLLKVKRTHLLSELGTWNQVISLYQKEKLLLVEFGGVLITEKELDYSIVLQTFSNIGLTPLKMEKSKIMYLRATPFLYRDTDFTFFFDEHDTARFLITSYEKTYYPKNVSFYGRSRNKNLVCYNFFEENDAPHAGIFAPTGAGKSFTLQNLISSFLKINVEDIYKSSSANLSRIDSRIRYFDKGFSAEPFFKLLSLRGYDCGIFASRIEHITYNVCEIESPDDFEFSLQMVNSILYAMKQKPLEGFEIIWYQNALKEVYEKKEWRSMLRSDISYLLSPHINLEDVYHTLIKRGYSPKNKIYEIREKEFNNLKQPLLVDVVRVLENSRSYDLLAEERKAIDSLLVKLKAICNQPLNIFARPTRINIQSKGIVYIDYEYLSSSEFFVPVLLSILKKLVYIDKFKKEEDKVAYYILDEAHNLFRNPFFFTALSVLAREARKYKISLIFSTQFFEEIPVDVVHNLHTKMIIAHADLESRRSYLQSFSKHIGMDLSESDFSKVYSEVEGRTTVVWYSKGVFSVVLPCDKYKEIVFDSRRKKIVTEDGLEIIKSSVVE